MIRSGKRVSTVTTETTEGDGREDVDGRAQRRESPDRGIRRERREKKATRDKREGADRIQEGDTREMPEYVNVTEERETEGIG